MSKISKYENFNNQSMGFDVGEIKDILISNLDIDYLDIDLYQEDGLHIDISSLHDPFFIDIFHLPLNWISNLIGNEYIIYLTTSSYQSTYTLYNMDELIDELYDLSIYIAYKK